MIAMETWFALTLSSNWVTKLGVGHVTSTVVIAILSKCSLVAGLFTIQTLKPDWTLANYFP